MSDTLIEITDQMCLDHISGRLNEIISETNSAIRALADMKLRREQRGEMLVVDDIDSIIKSLVQDIAEDCLPAGEFSPQYKVLGINYIRGAIERHLAPLKGATMREAVEVYTYPKGYGPGDPMSAYPKDDNDIEGQ